MTIIKPQWRLPEQVVAFSTTTAGGFSQGNYRGLNLGLHVGDDEIAVNKNRQLLQQRVGDEVQLAWLEQVHGSEIINLEDYRDVMTADAAVVDKPQKACLIMTADCLPVLLCNQSASKVAALHCGWQGLYQQLIGKTISKHFAGDKLMAWLGPAIAQPHYEVDTALFQRFTQLQASYKSAFIANRPNHYLMSLTAIAKQQLLQSGLSSDTIFDSQLDTFTDTRFYSYRRQKMAGRMATLIYLR